MSNELLPNIDDYLKSIDDNIPVDISDLDELIHTIRSKTGLPIDTCKILLREFFQQIRNEMLDNNIITIKDFGKFFIRSPKTGTKKKVLIKFKPSKNIKERLNNG